MRCARTRIRLLRIMPGLLCAAALLALPPASAQEEEAGGESGSLENANAVYQELALREKEETERRLEILRMRGEAARLDANTEELNAKSQNCKARRQAFEAGAQVNLCPNDEAALEKAEADAQEAAATLAEKQMRSLIEERVVELEQRLTQFASYEQLHLEQGMGQLRPSGEQPDPVLLLLGAARAVVRIGGDPELGLTGETAVFRIPFEARLDGGECIRTERELHGIEVGKRICPAGRGSLLGSAASLETTRWVGIRNE